MEGSPTLQPRLCVWLWVEAGEGNSGGRQQTSGVKLVLSRWPAR